MIIDYTLTQRNTKQCIYITGNNRRCFIWALRGLLDSASVFTVPNFNIQISCPWTSPVSPGIQTSLCHTGCYLNTQNTFQQSQNTCRSLWLLLRSCHTLSGLMHSNTPAHINRLQRLKLYLLMRKVWQWQEVLLDRSVEAVKIVVTDCTKFEVVLFFSFHTFTYGHTIIINHNTQNGVSYRTTSQALQNLWQEAVQGLQCTIAVSTLTSCSTCRQGQRRHASKEVL